ncbi:protein-glutamate O-methyltransferase CheR [Sphingomonas sp. MG17]|uniref:Protein-glutamate O-methyltransferase CheR n=1 Tax=Sphingomonas tagetis TaxID=2949092 RepID=A0A9X2HHT1_9SPHN|nr:protein-glutamate O-methyltransferase CheR [Sphingomonas tagetis]MCP3730172.1 protein-glutamate O-methyltransferase CheR [Sphingomonas tagetis]
MMPPGPPTFASAGATNVIGALLEQRTGQQIAANRAWRVETALKPVLRDHGLETLDQLVGRLAGERNGPLADAVVNALLNQETSFFRDAGVIETVVEAARALQAETPGRRLRIWSAGCSVGQEPYSLAMLFEELAVSRGFAMPEIVATDVCPSALARARAGRYSQFEIQRGLPVRRMVTWFDSIDGEWVVRPELARRVQFRCHNLTRDPAPIGKFDIVLCRNVLLYFASAVRRSVFDTLRSATREGGLLVLGAGETVIGQTDAFRPSERFRGFYQADGGQPAPARVSVR